MGSRFVRKVRTASGAVAVQIVTREGRQVVAVDHVGSAHTDAELGLLMAAARERLVPDGQDMLDLGPVEQAGARLGDVADWTRPADTLSVEPTGGRPRQTAAGGRVSGTASLLLWDLLVEAYGRLGFEALADDTFRALVCARIIEPTSKRDTLRVLDDIGVAAPALNTLYRCLRRVKERDYRDRLARACAAYSAAVKGTGGLILYDVTTLHFENDNEDDLRRVGMSKEHRVDPQVQVGLLVDPSGFPLEVHLFDGSIGETKTLIPVLKAFRDRHGLAELVVVADAGMLSAGNLNALEDAGYSFIVGSRLTKAPYDLADHFERHGDWFADGQILESSRVMGTGSAARERRIVYQYSFKRRKRDDKAIDAQIARAEKIAAGKAPVSRARFLKVAGADKQLNQDTIDRARRLAGLKGYVTNLPVATMDGQAVITAYHDLWQVEASFRLTKSDLRARPVFVQTRDTIEAHLTIVFAALAISRHLQQASGVTIRKLVQTLRPIRSATVTINGQHLTLEPEIPDHVQAILDKIRGH
ncbi:IS1634 family transposase [Raineyella sp. W15-4]|uniref:IS1634 family transposase n=1 Tax=Raineyella sp. W15-4 TaxID=3081651 RepID=UPI002955D609|nr:IS1634 family transposase [Raineyella sp. W15-4]WOQ15464.1 IS1634 family transposase [Raineyella sp. W15-4]WOQ15840.1 IS1634 family transposase [Raineyella sp. W15-4]WOQ17647.1 IS1634 family transposase [Raineyella sp. W15-4]